MIITRKFLNPDKRELLEAKLSDAEMYGYKFIEVRSVIQEQLEDTILGLDQVKVHSSRKIGSKISTTTSASIVSDGELRFHPDNRFFRWGYLPDTEKNRRWLAAQLKYPQVVISDAGIQKEIEALAEKLGFATEKAEVQDFAFDSYLKRSETDKERELREKIEALEKELIESKKETPKPLAGKSVTKKN